MQPNGILNIKEPINLIKKISPNDLMYQGNSDHYFHVGESAIQCIQIAILSAGKNPNDIKKILDFPCGYGRVLRMLKAVFPEAQLTGGDIDRRGVDFCSKVFGAHSIYSENNIQAVPVTEKFDLIWCGSLFTHLNSNQWPALFKFLFDSLEPEGILIFTISGRYVAGRIAKNSSLYGITDPEDLKNMTKDFEQKGFGYSNYYNSKEYGISITMPSYALNMLQRNKKLRLISYIEKGWDNHQDAIAYIKEPIAEPLNT